MTLIAAAVCPHPPLLVPEVAGVDPIEVRDHAVSAVSRLCALGPDRIVLVGDDVRDAFYDETSTGSLAGFGVDLTVPLGGPTSPARGAGADGADGVGGGCRMLPLSLTIGAWLLHEVGWAGARAARGVPATTTPQAAAALGAHLVAAAEADGSRLALLVMGDASARRTIRAPGSLDPRAAAHDAAVAAALAAVDVDALLALDPELARDLLAPGRASWQVLAGAVHRATAAALSAAPAGGAARPAAAAPVDVAPAGPAAGWVSRVHYDDAPFGVGYLVVGWERAGGAGGAGSAGQGGRPPAGSAR
ncbi:class III extradiol ring-cleavage dioxygenase family protein [Parafrankia elaeagni]|uniref:hypothetical protein n=1 Tax=Parafrankia elaeagni TaxID=222534 RepID=UPI00037D34E0|nr:hypothetical protein [Parafrankia elaeagni]